MKPYEFEIKREIDLKSKVVINYLYRDRDGDYCKLINEKGEIRCAVTLQDKFFPSLSYKEIDDAFGTFDLTQINKNAYYSNMMFLIFPLTDNTKKDIIKLEKALIKWLKKGLQKCQEIEEQRKLKDWIYPEKFYKI